MSVAILAWTEVSVKEDVVLAIPILLDFILLPGSPWCNVRKLFWEGCPTAVFV